MRRRRLSGPSNCIRRVSRPARSVKIASRQLGEGDNSLLKTPIEAVKIPEVVQKAIDAAERPTDGHWAAIWCGGDQPRRWDPVRSGETASPNDLSPCKNRFIERHIEVHERIAQIRSIAGAAVCESPSRDERPGRIGGQWLGGQLLRDGRHIVWPRDQSEDAEYPGAGSEAGIHARICGDDRGSVSVEGDAISTRGVFVGIPGMRVQRALRARRYRSARWKSNSAKLQQAGDVLYGVEADLPVLRSEPHQQSLEKFIPMAWIGPQNTTWDGEAREYLESIHDRMEVDDATRKTAAELTKNCRTKREKVAAIAAHVQQAYTYQGIEFGRRARIPNSAEKTMNLKYGDCKDHALLTRAAAGCGWDSIASDADSFVGRSDRGAAVTRPV